jgi:predicted NUDIX family NTP pyrophosphohydrolase
MCRASVSVSQALSSSNERQSICCAWIHIRRRLSWTFFSTTPFSQPLATLQRVRIEQVVTAHGQESGIDITRFASPDFVTTMPSDVGHETHQASLNWCAWFKNGR